MPISIEICLFVRRCAKRMIGSEIGDGGAACRLDTWGGDFRFETSETQQSFSVAILGQDGAQASKVRPS